MSKRIRTKIPIRIVGILILSILILSLVAPVFIPTDLYVPTVRASPGWLPDWDQRVKITLDHNDIDTALSNFPVLIYLSGSCGINSEDLTFVFDEVGANRKKIAVTESDGLTECYVEVDKWDLGNEKAWLWTKVPSIASGVDTDIYLYYDNDHVDNDAHVGDPNSVPAENVWDGNFKFVSHMQDDPDTSHVRDSTTEDNDGTKKGANEPIEAGGKISDAQHFDGTDDFIALGTGIDPISEVTFECWINIDVVLTNPRYMSKVEVGATQFIELLQGAGANTVKMQITDATAGTASVTGDTELNTGTWYHIAGTYKNSEGIIRLYVNGTLDGTSGVVLNQLSTFNEVTEIGRSTSDRYGERADGLFDEVRVSYTARSAAWLKATHESGRDHLNDFGVEEAGPSEEWWDIDWWYRISVDITSDYGALTNYQIYLDLHVAEGTSSGHDIYTGGTAQADYDDVRVLASDQLTLLDIWQVDNYSWSYPDTRFWVKVPSIPTIIWVYWGNDAVSSVSNGDNVFPFFDDFEINADPGDWTNQTGGGGWAPIVSDWFLECESASDNDGWSALECNDRQTLTGGSSTYGWSMEWDQHIRTYDINDGNEWCGATLSYDWMHDINPANDDDAYNGTSIYFRDDATWANRYVIYREWHLTPLPNLLPRQTNQTVYPFSAWGFLTTARGLTPSKWTYMQNVMFIDHSYVKLNGTILRELGSTPLLDHLSLAQGPTFSSKAWAGVGDWLRIGANWVFMRPIADPEPSLTMGKMEGYVVDVGILNREACGNWTFEGRTQYIFWINVTSPVGDSGLFSSGVGFFDDSGDWYSFFYSNATEQITPVSPDDGISVGLRSVETGDRWSYVTFNVMFNPTVADSADVNLYGRAVIPVFGDIGWIVGETDYFNIYNLGGYTSMESIRGVTGRSAGGDYFEMYVAPLGVVQTNLTYRNLQLYHSLFHWNIHDTWMPIPSQWIWAGTVIKSTNITIGMYYCVHDTWVEGWRVDIEKTNGLAGTYVTDNDQAWIELTAHWYLRENYVKNDTFYVWYEAYTEKDITTQLALFVDLWFNKENASTTVGGRVGGQFFGMEELGWGPWAFWAPSNETATSSMFFDTLLDENGEVVSCTEIKMMKVFFMIDSDDMIFVHELKEFQLLNIQIEPGSMRGIDTPTFVEPITPDMPSSNYLQSLLTGLLGGFGRQLESLWMMGFVAWTWIIEMLDVLFAALGAPDLMSTMSTAMVAWGDFFVESVVSVTSLIVQVFVFLRAVITPLISWFTRFITFFAGPNGLFVNVVKILDGTHTVVTGLSNVWDLMSLATWIDAIPPLAFVAWVDSIDRRAKQMGGGWFAICHGDLKIVSWILSFIMESMFSVITFVMDFMFNVARIIRG